MDHGARSKGFRREKESCSQKASRQKNDYCEESGREEEISML